MLRFIDIKPIVKSSIEIDYYVPITINIGEQSFVNENKIYWRTGNFNNSLLEIGIGEKSGELKSITLTMVNNVNTENIQFDISEILTGVPVFDISIINKSIYDDVSDYCVSLTIDDVLVTFSEKRVVKTNVNIDRVEIGFGFENELMFIKVNKLSPSEYTDLKDSFKL